MINKFCVDTKDIPSIYESCLSIPEYVELLGQGMKNKTDLYGDHKGSWQGIPHPVYVEGGIDGVVIEIGKLVESLRNCRKFTPLFGCYPYWGQRGDGGWTHTIEEIKRQVDVFHEIGVEMMSTFVHTQLDASKNVYISNDLDRFLQGILYAQSKGIKFNKIKLDCNEFRTEFLTADALRRDNLSSQWKTIIKTVCEKFSGVICELIVLNEPDILLKDTTTHLYIKDWIQYAQSFGYSVSISTISCMDHMSYDTSIFSMCDFIETNEYPSSGTRGIDSDIKEISNNIYKIVRKFVVHCNTLYPFKKVVIGEMGCMDNKDALLYPWVYKYTDTTDYNGLIQELFLRACYEGLKDTGISEFMWWHQFTDPYTMEKAIREYTGGLY